MTFRPRASHCLLALAISACTRTSSKADTAQTAPLTDSLVLERTACFGLCPVYRLRISNTEEIRFESRNRGDSGRVAVDTAPRGTYASLMSKARDAGFYDLPSEIRSDKVLCRNLATDHPTVTTTIFSGQTSKQIADYRGCFETVEHEVLPPIQILRAFEDRIDSTLRSSRWVRPNKPAK